MSMNENNDIVEPAEDLDSFSAEFFGQNEAEPEPASSEEPSDSEVEESDAQEEDDTQTIEDPDTLAPDDDDETEEDEEKDEEPAPKPKKNRFQERIDELNGKYREEERQRKALEARLNELTAKLEQNEQPKPEQKVEANKGPTPDDKLEDGTEKYPLGEFDPNYIRDLTKFTINEERKAIEDQRKQEELKQEVDSQRQALQAGWNEKLGPAQERYPDFQTKGQQLLQTFEGIDAAYGEYLSSTIMSMDFGPDVLYYLANNVEEANKIVSSGPAKATIALGRLEAKFAEAEAEKQIARPKVSKAPEPPAHLNKGSAVAKIETPDDTDDLDAFSKKLFADKRRA